MAVVLTVQVRDQLHRVVRLFEEPADDPFLRFCRSAISAEVRYVDFIWPYTDSMLNTFQLRAWLEDLPKALASDGLDARLRESVERMLEAAKQAESLEGYLFFEG